MNSWLYYPSLTVVGLTGVTCIYYGYYGIKKMFIRYVMDKVNEELNKRMENEEDDISFKPMHSNSALLRVKYGGKCHSVYVPYDRKKSIAMMRKKVFLMMGQEKIEITQKPGIPYIVCAKDLGGERILVEDLEGNLMKEYLLNQIPDCF